ncbi:MAG: glycosyltransferase family 39 protein [Phaeospirillum sp.]|nr:glycosyltransferase family 39 protein [Phaeospirillum sp.]
MSWGIVVLMSASCLGWGALVLRAAGIAGDLAWRERAAWSFGLGIGAIGWLGFFAALAGRVEPVVFAVVCAAGLPGLWTLRRIEVSGERLTAWTWALLALILAVLAGDLIEGLAPPTDADSLAYHFAIPRRILLDHRLAFVPRAVDGAVPLLLQMTYLATLALGGEQAMTLWCGVSGWAAVALTYALGRTVLGRDWALAGALAMATLPAFLYGAGSGQVEARLAAFTVIAVAAALRARDQTRPGFAAIAGLAAGFAMGAKYPSLLLVFFCGLALLIHRRGVLLAAVFSAAALLAGLQWYGWNWWNTGDPLFPVLYDVLPYHPGVAWNTAQNAIFQQWTREVEAPLPRGLLDFLFYPLLATFNPPSDIDAGRTGLGVLPALLVPFAAMGAWSRRHQPAARSWIVAALICLGFYTLWFVFGASQRVRHYLPLMPLIIVGLLAAAERAGSSTASRHALTAGIAAVLLLQSAGQAVFARNFVHRLTQGESRQAFIERNVPWGFAAGWANANLPAHAKIAVQVRQWIYLLDAPAFFAHPIDQAELEVREDNRDEWRFWRQMRGLGVTHLLLASVDPTAISRPTDEGGLNGMLGRAISAGCGRTVQTITGAGPVASRTLGGQLPYASEVAVVVVELTPESCRLIPASQ